MRMYPVIAHRQHPRLHPEALRNFGGHLGQRGAIAQAFGAIQMGGEVAVAKLEPWLAVELAKGFQCAEAFTGTAPSVGAVYYSRQGVTDRV